MPRAERPIDPLCLDVHDGAVRLSPPGDPRTSAPAAELTGADLLGTLLAFLLGGGGTMLIIIGLWTI